jgi:NitT/TauT family transport system substrate-binding protein
MACDSLNKFGFAHYRQIVTKYYGLKDELVDSLPRDIKFAHYSQPRDGDRQRARQWLDKTMKALSATRR